MSFRVSGNKILHNGHEIQFHSVNLNGMELPQGVISGLWADRTIADYVKEIVDMGFNGVRLPIGGHVLKNIAVTDGTIGVWQGGKNEKLMKGKKSLDVLDMLIDELERMGLYYVFDLHHIENGGIPSLWYTPDYSEEQWLEDLSFLADRYMGRESFIGIDIKNEPGNTCKWGSGEPANDWKIACEKAFEAIDAVNSDILIIVEAFETSVDKITANMPSIPADRLVLSMHIYFSDVWGQYVDYFKAPNFPANLPAIWDGFFGNAVKTHCIYIGEFGGKYGKGEASDKTAQDAFAAYCRARGILHTSYWLFGPDSYDTGGLLLDGWRIKRDDKIKMLETMRTPLATFSFQDHGPVPEPTPIPTPVPVPTPTPTPIPEPTPMPKPTPTPTPPLTHVFKRGDIVKFVTGGGPDMFVGGYDEDDQKVLVAYFNITTGEFVEIGLAEDLLKKK